MGRTKSWLALVLAIVMVFSMAVPTAFAAGTTTKPLYWYKSYEHGNVTDRVTKGTHSAIYDGLTEGGAPLTLYLSNGISDDSADWDDADRWVPALEGKDVQIKIENNNEDFVGVTAEASNGSITITPRQMTTFTNLNHYSFNVIVTGYETGVTYRNTFYYKVKHAVKYADEKGSSEIVLDVAQNNVVIPTTFTVKPFMIKAASGDVVTITGGAITKTLAGTAPLVVPAPAYDSYTGAVTVGNVSNVAFSGVLTVYVEINGIPDQVDIPVSIGNVAETTAWGYKIGHEGPSSISVYPNATPGERTIGLYVADRNGNGMNSTTQVATRGYTLSLLQNSTGIALTGNAPVVASVVVEGYLDSVETDGVTTPAVGLDGNVTLNAYVDNHGAQTTNDFIFNDLHYTIPAGVVSGSGYLKVLAYSVGYDNLTDFNAQVGGARLLQQLIIPIEILPYDFAGLPTETLVFDLNGDDVKYVDLSKSGNYTLSTFDVTPSDFEVSPDSGNITVTSTSVKNQFKLTANEESKGTIRVRVKINDVYTAWKTFKYIVNDNRAKPSISVSKDALAFDLNGKTTDSVVLTSVPLIGKAGVIRDPEYKLVVDGVSVTNGGVSEWETYGVFDQVPNTFVGFDNNYFKYATKIDRETQTTVEFHTNWKRIVTGTIYVRAEVDGIKTAWVPLTTTINDTAKGHAHHVAASISNINGSVTDLPTTFQAMLENSDNEKVADTNVRFIDYELYDSNMESYEVNHPWPITLKAIDTVGYGSDTFAITYNRGGSGYLVLKGIGIYGEATEKVIPFNITALPVNATPTTLAFDYAGATSINIEITPKNGKWLSLWDIRNATTNRAWRQIETTPARVPGLKSIVINDALSVLSTDPDYLGTGYVYRYSKLVLTAEVNDRTSMRIINNGDFSIDNLMVDAKMADITEVNYSIADTTSVYATPNEINLSVKSGGTAKASFTLYPNPKNVESWSHGTPVSSDVNIATVALQDGHTYVVTAVAKGNTTIVVPNCKIGGKAVGDCVVTVKVDPDVTVPYLTLGTSRTTLYVEDEIAKTATYDWSLSSGTLSGETLSIVSSTPTTEGATVISIDEATKTITALAEGTATVQLSGKVGGQDILSNPVTLTVAKNITPAKVAGLYIDGVLYTNGSTLYIPNNYKAQKFAVSLVTATGAEINNVTLSETKLKSKDKKKFVLGTSKLQPTLVWGETKLTATGSGASETVQIFVKALPDDGTKVNETLVAGFVNPQAGSRGYYFDYIHSNPLNAYYIQPKFWKFTSNKCAVACVNSKGIVSFLKAGTVTIKATKKSGSGNKAETKSFSITLTVTDEYTKTAFHGAVLSSSANAASIAGAFNSQKYPMGGATQTFTYDAAGYESMISYLKSSAGENDISAVYIDGAITKSGVTIGTKSMTLTALAEDLSQIEGKVFLALNGAGSAMYTKDAQATPADIAKAFATVEASMKDKASAIGEASTNNFWSMQKFYVLSATSKNSQSIGSKASAFETAFAAALTQTNGAFPSGGSTVTLKQLYNQMKKTSGITFGYYPTNVSGIKVGYYAN